jgi:transglutaminase-like putative cysteine protease
MQYEITHVTRYQYTSPVSVCHNLLTLSPRVCKQVSVLKHAIRIKPTPTVVTKWIDFFGNHVEAFSLDENHDELAITARSRVIVNQSSPPLLCNIASWSELVANLAAGTEPNWMEASAYMFDSPRVERLPIFRDYCQATFFANRDVVSAALSLCQQIHRDFKYDTTATNSATHVTQAFALKRGVCQDLAHIMIACLRSMGLAARYVSGYLRTLPPPGKARLVGADQSHAWVAVYCGPQSGWIDVDPTNNCLCNLDHIPIAWGRDYTDVVPVRGAFSGGGDSSINVSVDVAPCNNGE